MTTYFLPVGFLGFWDPDGGGYAILPLLNGNITTVRNWSEITPAEPGFTPVRQQEAVVPVCAISTPFSGRVYQLLNAFLAFANNQEGLQYYALNGIATVGPSLLWVNRSGHQFTMVKIPYPRLARWSVRTVNTQSLIDLTFFAGITDVPNSLPNINTVLPENGDGINLLSAIQRPSSQLGVPDEYLVWNRKASTRVGVDVSIDGEIVHVTDVAFLADYHLQPSYAGGQNPSGLLPSINPYTFAQSEPVWYWVQTPMFMLAIEVISGITDDLVSTKHTLQHVWVKFIHTPSGLANGIGIYFPVAKVVEGIKRQMSGQFFRRLLYLQAGGTPPRLFLLDNSIPREGV